jgi:hypothetical protein
MYTEYIRLKTMDKRQSFERTNIKFVVPNMAELDPVCEGQSEDTPSYTESVDFTSSSQMILLLKAIKFIVFNLREHV